MNKSLLLGVAIGGAAAIAAGAFAGYKLGSHGPQSSSQSSSRPGAQAGPRATAVGAGRVAAAHSDAGHAPLRPRRARYARVVQVIPLTRQVVIPRQQCHDVTVTHVRPSRDNHQIIGSIAGAVVGGLIGHQIGGGTGKDIATAAGAAAGGFAGNRIEKHIQNGDTYTTTRKQCRTVYEKTRRPDGYEVRYRLNGRQGTVRMSHDPGQTIPVRDGRLVLTGGQRT